MAQIADVIKYEGDNSVFIWKHPAEDFNSLTQLIVHESQEAIFFMNGEALDLFGPGRHTLETQNIPLIGKALGKTTDNKHPFHCEVYFINKTVQMALKWGTESKIKYLDPSFGFPVEIGACGELNLAVADSRKLLVKLVGTTRGIAWNETGSGFTKSIANAFRPLISTAVKSSLVNVIKENSINLLEIDEKLDVVSEALRKSILPGFEEYGLTIPEFYVTNIALPEDENFKNFKKLQTMSFQTRVIQAEAFIKATQAEAEASVIEAERKITLEKEATETEKTKRQAERDIIEAQTRAENERLKGMAEAEVTRAKGIAEAEVMRAKGYTERDVLASEVQKAYAEGIGNMNISGGGASGVAGDMIGLGVGLAAAGAVAPKLGEMFSGMNSAINSQPATASAPAPTCAKCGAPLPENAKFCLECGEKVAPEASDTVVCPACKSTVNKGKFCSECGYKFITACPSCGVELAIGAKFCPECGQKL